MATLRLRLDGLQDLALLLMRLLTGLFLVYGVMDNVVSPARMAEFAAFLDRFGFAPAGFWAPVSVFAQLACGLSLVLGVGARAAGFVLAVHFAVAIAMVDIHGGLRAAFPAAALVAIGLQTLAFGAGRHAIDRRLARRWPAWPA